MNPYRELFKAMNDAGIRYLVVGGVAVNLHGFRRFTADVDILLALDEENLKTMTTLMHERGYVERLPIPLEALSDLDHVRQLLKEKGMTAFTFLSNNRERIDVDVLAGKSIEFNDYDARKLLVKLEDELFVPVISIDDLISLKKEANREQDVRDIAILLQLKGLEDEEGDH